MDPIRQHLNAVHRVCSQTLNINEAALSWSYQSDVPSVPYETTLEVKDRSLTLNFQHSFATNMFSWFAESAKSNLKTKHSSSSRASWKV